MIGSGKMTKKLRLCMVTDVKLIKVKTWPLSKLMISESHVHGNTKFDPGNQFYVFTLIECFFPQFLKRCILKHKMMNTPKMKSIMRY